MLIEIMVEILSGLVLVDKLTHQGRVSKIILPTIAHEAFVKRRLGRKAIEKMLQKLDALTMEESQMIAEQTLKVAVHGVHQLFR